MGTAIGAIIFVGIVVFFIWFWRLNKGIPYDSDNDYIDSGHGFGMNMNGTPLKHKE